MGLDLFFCTYISLLLSDIISFEKKNGHVTYIDIYNYKLVSYLLYDCISYIGL